MDTTLDTDSSGTTRIVDGFENIPIITMGINPAIEVGTGFGIQDWSCNTEIAHTSMGEVFEDLGD